MFLYIVYEESSKAKCLWASGPWDIFELLILVLPRFWLADCAHRLRRSSATLCHVTCITTLSSRCSLLAIFSCVVWVRGIPLLTVNPYLSFVAVGNIPYYYFKYRCHSVCYLFPPWIIGIRNDLSKVRLEGTYCEMQALLLMFSITQVKR